jgi:Uma2 family endonuclease
MEVLPMIAQPSQLYISPEEYLEGEKISLVKHEYIDGQIYAMAGTSDSHNIVLTNLLVLLRQHLRGSGCLPFFADMKVKIPRQRKFYYPDLLVTCDDRDRENRYFKEYPKVIIEVLSDSTEAFDRGKKFEDYRSLPSLEEYVLIRQDRPQIECFRRNEAGRWELYEVAEAGTWELASVGFQADLQDLYEDVVFELAMADGRSQTIDEPVDEQGEV